MLIFKVDPTLVPMIIASAIAAAIDAAAAAAAASTTIYRSTPDDTLAKHCRSSKDLHTC